MIRFTVSTDVPENRQVVVTLPPEVPTGPTELVVEVRSEPDRVYEVKLDPELLKQARSDRPSDLKLAREFDAFERLLPELLKTCRGQYVAIHEGRVVATGTEKLEVAHEAYRQFGRQPILVRLVAEQQPVIRIPSIWRTH